MKNFAVIFDCDGTLVDSLSDAMLSFHYALDKIGEPPREPQVIKQYFGAGADRIFLKILGNKEKALQAFELYIDHVSELAPRMKLHLGIRELLDTLREMKVPMSVVTGRHERDLEVVLRPHLLSEYFISLVADNQLPLSKPAPDGVLLAARQMKIEPGSCLYVGDSVVDIQAARTAGMFSAAALWDSLCRIEEMQAAGPDLLASKPADILKFLQAKLSGAP